MLVHLIILLLLLQLCGTGCFYVTSSICHPVHATLQTLFARGGTAQYAAKGDSEGDSVLLPIQLIKRSGSALCKILTRNPIARIFINTYSFFYWLPKRNTPYDNPWQLFKNSSVEWISWYQFPHNLPPYRYLDSTGFAEGYRHDFFCYGLPGNTLPLGNWDPAGFQLVHERVLHKYRESEVKHGRLAMLSSLGFAVQEVYHPLHPEIGGMAITHMLQLRELGAFSGALGSLLLHIGGGSSDINSADSMAAFWNAIPLDYVAVCSLLAAFEIVALKRNWSRWQNTEYNHQFDQNIGIGNLKKVNFDPILRS